MTIWIKVTADKFEHIVEMGDTATILARKLHMKSQSIVKAAYLERKTGKWCPYKMIEIDEGDDE